MADWNLKELYKSMEKIMASPQKQAQSPKEGLPNLLKFLRQAGTEGAQVNTIPGTQTIPGANTIPGTQTVGGQTQIIPGQTIIGKTKDEVDLETMLKELQGNK